MLRSYIRRPHAATQSLTAQQVAKAYNLPAGDGTGVTIGIIELGGAFNASDMARAGLDGSNVTTVTVGKGKPKSDGPNGADGEVMLDVEVVAAVSPGAKLRIYFASQSDADFLAAIVKATAECQYISISWGSAEGDWDPSSITQFSAAFKAARDKGVIVFAAAGDSGSRDGTKTNQVDYPASDPNVVGCGGTRLAVTPDGSRKAEITWDDNDTTSATGGGVSTLFPGRHVPDVAGNADPATGYQIVVDGQSGVIGGTSAVAPLYAAMCAVIRQRRGTAFDFANEVATHPAICFDVLSGDNGAYRAGAGRDDVTGWGVVDFGKLDALLTSGAPVMPPVTPPVVPPPVTTVSKDRAFIENIAAQMTTYLKTASAPVQ